MNVAVLFAEGFEEIEGITIVDVLRRANVNVATVSIGKKEVHGSHAIVIRTDKALDEVKPSDFQMVVLPGGMPGSKNLKDDPRVITLLQKINTAGGYIGAICAAPMVLGHAGLLQNKKATCFPGFEAEMKGATSLPEPVVVDGRIITGKGPGCAIPFALKLVEIISGPSEADTIKNSMQVYWM